MHCEAGDFEFRAGDWVIFPKGLECEWEIKEKKKNHSFG
ncbi:MAG: DUF861 domain-containing protein [Nanoarchaeota archaeon]|nr:DUF861 domain-containing protein [Nanoarchaeota archaeon]